MYTRLDLRLLCYSNGKRTLPQIEVGGIRHEWVGFGWVEDGPAKGTEALMLDGYGIEVDGKHPKPKRVLFKSKGRREPNIFQSRTAAKQFLRSHSLEDLNPTIVPVPATAL